MLHHLAAVVGLLCLGVPAVAVVPTTPAQEPPGQEPAKPRVDLQLAAQRLRGEVRATLGEARFGGVWVGQFDKRIKVGVTRPPRPRRPRPIWPVIEVSPPIRPPVDDRAQRIVLGLAARHGVRADVDPVTVYHTMAEIEACHKWVHRQAKAVSEGAPSPVGSVIATFGPDVVGVVIRLPEKATKAQEGLVLAAQEHCHFTMINYVKAGEVSGRGPFREY